MTTTDGGGAIARLAAELDALLPANRLPGRPGEALQAAARRWSDAVWQVAVERGPLTFDAATIARGLDLARRPVFICGVHRSGTTLLRDLLDSHPSLIVLPSEGAFRRGAVAAPHHAADAERIGGLGREWLRRLANPINQPPYWLLGRPSAGDSSYVQFARALLAWWPLVGQQVGRTNETWPLAALALSYASASLEPTAWHRATRWVEKTPTNEEHIAQLRREWPEARFVQVIRHPLAVFSSRKTLEERTHGRLAATPRIMRELRATYLIAREESDRRRDDYRLLRYEQLVESPPDVMGDLAAALGVEMRPILLEPTVAGRPASSNSSFRAGMAAGQILLSSEPTGERLTPAERALVIAAAGEPARMLGYVVEPMNRWRARLLRVRHGIW